MEICYRVSKKIVKRMRKWKSSAPAGSRVDEDLDEEIAYQLQLQDLMNVHPNFVQASSSSTGNSQARFPGTKSVVVTESEENFLRAFGINLKPRILRKECGICFETRPHSSFITTNSCAHEYCRDCCKRHAEGKIVSGSSTIECPHASCGHSYDIQQCTALLSKSSLHTLNMRLVEQAIPPALRVYCPVPGCSAFMEKSDSQGTFAECLACHRAFCQACHVPWHSNQTCSEFRAYELNTKLSGDQKFRDLAKQEKWQNCPHCQRFVERTAGCRHITCVCQNEFCYSCGKKYKNKAASCKC